MILMLSSQSYLALNLFSSKLYKIRATTTKTAFDPLNLSRLILDPGQIEPLVPGAKSRATRQQKKTFYPG